MKLSQALQHFKELLMHPESKEATYVICVLLLPEVDPGMWNINLCPWRSCGWSWDLEQGEGNGPHGYLVWGEECSRAWKLLQTTYHT